MSSIEVASLAVKPMSKPLCGVQSLFEPETQDKPAGKEPYKPLRDLPESISQNRCEYPFLTSFTYSTFQDTQNRWASISPENVEMKFRHHPNLYRSKE
jgi:hypothetical protein